MNNEFPYADLVVLGAIAAFILLRLRSTLGKKTGMDVSQPVKPLEDGYQPVIPASGRPALKLQQLETMEEVSTPSVISGLEAVQKADANFNAQEFLAGAKMAFEMVSDAFAKGDKTTLKMLLADEVYAGFEKEIISRDARDTKTETTLISVRPKEITMAALEGTMARITVLFAMEEITVIRGKSAEIIEGDPSHVETGEVDWTFERDTKARNPNWKIIET